MSWAVGRVGRSDLLPASSLHPVDGDASAAAAAALSIVPPAAMLTEPASWLHADQSDGLSAS
jgi:hypothetical protein